MTGAAAPTIDVAVLPTLAGVAPSLWDELGGDDHPFVEHAYLHGLEASGCVGEGTSWQPLYLLAVEPAAAQPDEGLPSSLAGCRLLGAAPVYLRGDSWGEFIFDFAWASQAHRMGLPYYPKLTAAVPFTPATGPRLLLRRGATDRGDEAAAVQQALAVGLRELAEACGAHSAHWLFLPQAELQTLQSHGYFPRVTAQARWDDAGYGDFEGFLASRRAPIRKQIRKERRAVSALGLDIAVVRGDEMDDLAWQAVWRFYVDHCRRHGSQPWLNEAFFAWIRRHLGHRVRCSLARDRQGYVAGTLNFVKGRTFYGRYWGYREQVPLLHFEMAFYLLIEHCLTHGYTRMEAGAGGAHKLQRGLDAVAIHSAHWIADPRLAAVLQAATARERGAMTAELEAMRERGTARRDGG